MAEISTLPSAPDATGHFGSYGGMFVPETLMAALEELIVEYDKAKADPDFHAELNGLLKDYCGRETPLYFAERWTEQLGGAKIYLKREDLLHTGAHKINNALGQALLAKRLGKKRIIAETGAGQHGVATATVCARFGLEMAVEIGVVGFMQKFDGHNAVNGQLGCRVHHSARARAKHTQQAIPSVDRLPNSVFAQFVHSTLLAAL